LKKGCKIWSAKKQGANNNDPVFCTPYFGPDFLKVPDPKKISGRPDKLDNRVQIDWSTMYNVNANI
jgi:hypothetical protein